MRILNEPSPSDVIPSTTLNLTKITTIIAGALGIVTAGNSIAARNDDGLSDTTDWVGFTQDQRFVIIVVLIAAVTLIHAVDLLARAIATARSTSTAVVPLPKAAPARLSVNGDPDDPHRDGQMVAVRPDGQVLFHHTRGNTGFEWVAGEKVELGS